MADPVLTITICPVDREEVGRALAAVATKLDKKAEGLKPGIARDNLRARAIRLERMATELKSGE